MQNPKLFISYASEDRPIALEVGRHLREKMGIDAFMDFWEIRPGDDFVSRLNEGLAQADHFVLILSPASIQKPWPLAEQSVATLKAIEDGDASGCSFCLRSRAEVPALCVGPSASICSDCVVTARQFLPRTGWRRFLLGRGGGRSLNSR